MKKKKKTELSYQPIKVPSALNNVTKHCIE